MSLCARWETSQYPELIFRPRLHRTAIHHSIHILEALPGIPIQMHLPGITVVRRLMLRFLSVSTMDGRPAPSEAMVAACGISGYSEPYLERMNLSTGRYE